MKFAPLVFVVLFMGSGCSSPPVDLAGQDTPVSCGIRLDDYRSGVVLQLVNSSHPEFQGLYSQTRDTANTKILDDEEMESLLSDIYGEGFENFAKPAGSLPEQAEDRYADVLTITIDGSGRYVGIPRRQSDAPRDEVESAAKIKALVFGAFQAAVGFQSVENEKGKNIFPNDSPGRNGRP